MGIGEHFIEGCTDKFAEADDSDFLISQFDIVARKKPINGGGGSRIKFGVLA